MPLVRRVFERVLRGRASLFMVHRFRDEERGVAGQDPDLLRAALEWMRRERCRFISVQELFQGFESGRLPKRAVAFTIDDGYLEQATIGGPVFAEFDCPVTTFVTTGFLDGHLWFWWDQIEYVFGTMRGQALRVALAGAALEYRWDDPAGRRAAQRDFTNRCKRVPTAEKLAAVLRLATAADVVLPDRPPPAYLPMSWADLRRCEERGMTFGPHTVTHPILARTDDASSGREIATSWERLRSEALRPVAVFCYPNGTRADFGARELATLRSLGFSGAVMGEPGYADVRDRSRPDARFHMPRFSLPRELVDVMEIVAGVEWIKERLASSPSPI